jgi:hypothetical protein
MRRLTLLAIASALAFPVALTAQDNVVMNAMSAGPLSISFHARIMTWDGTVIREGSNGWTCLPDRSDTPTNDPWCVDETWLGFLDALVNGREPSYNTIGVAYMLMGDTPVSNTDPAATSKTTDADWVVDLRAHLMMLIPDRRALEGVSTDAYNGGPWVMWPDTPYAHLMIPIDSFGKP